MADFPLYVGIGSGVLTAISSIPQLVKLIKKKKADDLSYGMYAVLLCGVAGWIWYGILNEDYPIIATNSFSLIVDSTVLGLSIKYKKNSE